MEGGSNLFGRLGCAIKGIRGPPKSELETLLDSVTRTADSIDVNQVALEAVVRYCADETDRRTIMRHVHHCLAESGASQWRCVYLGLQVLEQLFSRGPPELVTEAATGAHFDVVQRLSFLEKYEMGIDMRVQNLVRRKAEKMKAEWLEIQSKVELGGGEAAAAPSTTAGTKTPGARSSKSYKTATSRQSDDTDDSGDDRARKPVSSDPRVNVVRYNQNDSTDDEAPAGAHKKASSGAKVGGGGFSSDPRVAGLMRRPGDDSTDDEDDSRAKRAPRSTAAAQKPAAAAPPAAGVDLMGLLDDPVSPPAAAAKPAAAVKPATDIMGMDDLLGGTTGGGSASSSKNKFPEPGGDNGPDWLAMAQNHGLYSSGKPGDGDLQPVAQQPASKEASLLDF